MANLRIKMFPTFPTQVTGDNGLSIEKTNGAYRLSLDWTSMPNDFPAVRWNEEQIIQEANRGIARSNIQAVGYEEQSITSDQQQQARENIGAERLSVYNVKNYGATGDGSTDDSTAFASAMTAANSAGGGVVYVPPGTYRVRAVVHKSNVLIRGAGANVTIIKMVDDLDGTVFVGNNNLGSEAEFLGLEAMTLDGNKDGVLGSVAASAASYAGIKYFYAKDVVFQNATGYGLGLQGYALASVTGVQEKVYLENCHFLNNGDGTGGDTYDGLDVKDVDFLTMIHCRSSGNSDAGLNLRGDRITMIGCVSDGDCVAPTSPNAGIAIIGNADPDITSTSCRLISCEALNTVDATCDGFVFANGGGVGATQPVRIDMFGCIAAENGRDGIRTSDSASLVDLRIQGGASFANAGNGVFLGGTTADALIGGGIKISGNGGDGIRTEMTKACIGDALIASNTGYGINENSAGTRTIVAGACRVESNTAGNFNWQTNGRRHIGSGLVDYNVGSGDIIASASTITLPEGGNVFYITGTTTITSIAASRRGRMVALELTNNITITTGGNLSLPGNFVGSSGAHIILECDGTSWYECARRYATMALTRAGLGLAIGTDVQAFDADLAALAGNASNGIWARTGAGTGSARTLTGTSRKVSITNGDGVSGNPTITLPSIMEGIETVVAANGAAGSAHTGTITETTVLTVAIPANSLGPNGYLRFEFIESHTNNANNKIIRAKFGGSTLGAVTRTTSAGGREQFIIQNRNATNSQRGGINGSFGAGNLNSAAIDTTTAQNLTLTVELANTGDSVTIEGYIIKTCYIA